MSKKYLTSNSEKTEEGTDAQRNSTLVSSAVSNSELNRQLQHNGSTLSGGISGQRGQTWGEGSSVYDSYMRSPTLSPVNGSEKSVLNFQKNVNTNNDNSNLQFQSSLGFEPKSGHDFQLEGGLGGQFRNVDVGTSGSGYSVSGSSSIKSQIDTSDRKVQSQGDGKLTLGRERFDNQDGFSSRGNTSVTVGGSGKTGQKGGNLNLNLSQQNTTSGTTDKGFESKTQGSNFGVQGQFSDYSPQSGTFQLNGGINHNHSITDQSGISDIQNSSINSNIGGLGSSSGMNWGLQGSQNRGRSMGLDNGEVLRQNRSRGLSFSSASGNNNFNANINLSGGIEDRTKPNWTNTRDKYNFSVNGGLNQSTTNGYGYSGNASLQNTVLQKEWNSRGGLFQADDLGGFDHRARLNTLSTKGSLGGNLSANQASGNFALEANLLKGEHNIISPEISRKVLDEDIRARATSKNNFDVGAQAKGNASVNAGVVDFWNGNKDSSEKEISANGNISAFAGAKAGSSLQGEVVWDRKDNYGDVLKEHLTNFPGTWDDKLIENIPEGWITKASKLLFGTGRTRLVGGEIGGDIRAGAGADLGGSASVGKDGYVELGGNVGASMGLGGGVNAKGGINPIGVSRFGALKGMEATNAGYDRHDQAVEALKQKMLEDAQRNGQALEESKKNGGLTGKMSEGLLNLDKWIRGLD